MAQTKIHESIEVSSTLLHEFQMEDNKSIYKCPSQTTDEFDILFQIIRLDIKTANMCQPILTDLKARLQK
jgi:hypothetical protein